MDGIRVVGLINGVLLVSVAAFMLIPAVADLVANDPDWFNFLAAAFITGFVGGLLILANQTDHLVLGNREAFLVTVSGWILVAAFGALPFVFSSLDLSYTDALFESFSGVTTTGATVLVGLDHMPPGLLLWRALLQWLGGIGIVVTAIAILPFLRIGGMQLFRTESSDRSEKLYPRPAQIAIAIGSVYTGLTFMCAAAYVVAGMSAFDAMTHAMTTVATAGHSTYDASFAQFDSAAIRFVACVFMLAGALPLVLYVHTLQRGRQLLWRDTQVQTFLLIVAVFCLLIIVWLWLAQGMQLADAISHGTFNVISIATTTGYASADYNEWGSFAFVIFFILMFIGGCTGSTAGGIKTFRFQIMGTLLRAQMLTMLYPRGVQTHRYAGKQIGVDVIQSVALYVFLVFISIAVLAVALALTGLDPVTALSGAVSAIANIGPGLGPQIGPSGNFRGFSDPAKWMMCAGMLLGRLELLTVLIVLSPGFWRR